MRPVAFLEGRWWGPEVEGGVMDKSSVEVQHSRAS
jgi:hypothetical protein